MLIKRAKEFAYCRHNGQLRQGGELFFNHLERVANKAFAATGNQAVMAAGYLHDAVEDEKATLAEIFRLFGVEVGTMVQLLTRQHGVSYKNYIRRLKQSGNLGAIAIKIADNEDNLCCLGDGAFEPETEDALSERWFWSWAILTRPS